MGLPYWSLGSPGGWQGPTYLGGVSVAEKGPGNKERRPDWLLEVSEHLSWKAGVVVDSHCHEQMLFRVSDTIYSSLHAVLLEEFYHPHVTKGTTSFQKTASQSRSLSCLVAWICTQSYAHNCHSVAGSYMPFQTVLYPAPLTPKETSWTHF